MGHGFLPSVPRIQLIPNHRREIKQSAGKGVPGDKTCGFPVGKACDGEGSACGDYYAWRESNSSPQTPCDESKLGKSPSSGGANSDAISAEIRESDPDLLSLIESWSALPEAIRAAITAMVRAAMSAR
jgi:hypothetical protein